MCMHTQHDILTVYTHSSTILIRWISPLLLIYSNCFACLSFILSNWLVHTHHIHIAYRPKTSTRSRQNKDSTYNECLTVFDDYALSQKTITQMKQCWKLNGMYYFHMRLFSAGATLRIRDQWRERQRGKVSWKERTGDSGWDRGQKKIFQTTNMLSNTHTYFAKCCDAVTFKFIANGYDYCDTHEMMLNILDIYHFPFQLLKLPFQIETHLCDFLPSPLLYLSCSQCNS